MNVLPDLISAPGNLLYEDKGDFSQQLGIVLGFSANCQYDLNFTNT